jgi:hypothetical protein
MVTGGLQPSTIQIIDKWPGIVSKSAFVPTNLAFRSKDDRTAVGWGYQASRHGQPYSDRVNATRFFLDAYNLREAQMQRFTSIWPIPDTEEFAADYLRRIYLWSKKHIGSRGANPHNRDVPRQPAWDKLNVEFHFIEPAVHDPEARKAFNSAVEKAGFGSSKRHKVLATRSRSEVNVLSNLRFMDTSDMNAIICVDSDIWTTQATHLRVASTSGGLPDVQQIYGTIPQLGLGLLGVVDSLARLCTRKGRDKKNFFAQGAPPGDLMDTYGAIDLMLAPLATLVDNPNRLLKTCQVPVLHVDRLTWIFQSAVEVSLYETQTRH